MTAEIVSRIRSVRGGVRRGHLTGTTVTAGTPEVPVSRVVQLFERQAASPVFILSGGLIAQTLSDRDGAWRFDGLFASAKYAVVAYDHTGQYDPVIKTNLAPTVE